MLDFDLLMLAIRLLMAVMSLLTRPMSPLMVNSCPLMLAIRLLMVVMSGRMLAFYPLTTAVDLAIRVGLRWAGPWRALWAAPRLVCRRWSLQHWTA